MDEMEFSNAKMAVETEQKQNAGGAVGIGYAPMQGESQGYRRSSQLEKYEKRPAESRINMQRARRAADFFRNNPAFDEFIQLVREGIINI